MAPGMKLKLNASAAAAQPSQKSQTPTTTTPGGSLKLSFKRPDVPANSPPLETSKPSTGSKRPLKMPASTSSMSRKRPRENETSEVTASAKKKAKFPTTLKLNTSGMSTARKNSAKTPVATPRVTLKTKTKIAARPLGVGYDSEAEDAELDPAIEENFILRMQEGPDCDYLRQAINDRKIGESVNNGGADVYMRFFTRDARRGCIGINGRYYATVMVDLPCIVESMKSWDKRGWWKSADVAQMLYVFRQVKNEEEARTCDLPKEIDQTTWQWPDGLTPPMKNVRKRRFRKRLNLETIEKVEEEIEKQLALDEQCRKHGGTTEYEVIDLDAMREQDEESSEVDTEDEEDEDDEEEEEEENDEAVAARLAAHLGGDDESIIPIADSTIPTEAPTPTAVVDTNSGVTSGEAVPTPVDTPGHPPDIESAEDDDEDDDDEDEDEPAEEDEETREKAAFEAQQREEIAHIEREIAAAKKQHAERKTSILKARDEAKIRSLENDLQVKKRAIGLVDDDDT